jgi:hypothetical protein
MRTFVEKNAVLKNDATTAAMTPNPITDGNSEKMG